MRPLLILDVDGVVLPLPPRATPCPPTPTGFADARAWGYDVWVPEHLPTALQELARAFELVWCSDWENAANAEVCPLLGLPALRTLHPLERWHPRWKLQAVKAYAGARALAWADDQMRASARAWARERRAATLLLKPARERGLTGRQLTLIRRFGSQLST